MRPMCLALVFLAGCLPEEATDPSFQSVADASPSDAAPADVGAQDQGVVDAAPDMGPPIPCTYPADCPGGDCVDGLCLYASPVRCLFLDECGADGACPDGQACVDGTCQVQCPVDEVCGGFQGGLWCYEPCEQARTCRIRPRPCSGNIECPKGSVCKEDRCINACEHDGQCPADGYCFEGECRPFPQDLFTGDAPAPLAEPGQLLAGVAVVPLDYPLGVSMAGFGARPGPRNPYAVALGGSDRYFEEQDVRAIVLSTADDVLILLRLPLCWSTDYLLTRTALKVQAATGVNYADKIVSFATHSHSQPGRFWNLVPATGFGIFGYGQFSSEMVERYSDSFAAAIVQALGDLKPAKVGVRVVDDFDPARRIHSNRRSEFPEFTDDRMTVIRVDELDGTPMAAVVSLAIHGTHMELPWVTGDVAGGIEVVATKHLSAAAGKYVPVIFANGNAANVSPRGDDGTEVNWGKMQVVGHRVWPIFKAAWDAIEPQAAPVLEVVQKRIPVSYSLLGYDRSVPEFRANDGTAQEYGAFQCVAQGHSPDEPPYRDGALGCLLNLQTFLGQPTVQLQKTVLSAFRIDNTVIATLPGEPSSQLGLELAAELEADARAAGLADMRAVNFGYAMDHHLYLVLEDDWFRGGYEAAQGLWGWKLGRYFLNNARDLTGQLFTAEREDNASPIKPTIWPDLADDTVLPTAGAMAAGTLVMDTPAAAVRGDLLELRWIGGHPGVDRPDVVLQVAGEDGTFADFVHEGVRVDDRGFETLTFYLGDFEGDHLWAVRWELPFDMPVGRYRIHVAGDGVQGEGTAPYTVDGAAFDLAPATLVARDVGVADGVLALRVNYPDGPSNDDGASPFEALEIRGHLLRLDPEMRYDGALRRWSFLLGPAVPLAGLTATMDDVALDTVAAADQVGRTLVTARAEDGAETTADLAGWSSTRLEIQAPAAPATVRVSDAWGNFVDVEIAAEP